jgi:hypothetical protein
MKLTLIYDEKYGEHIHDSEIYAAASVVIRNFKINNISNNPTTYRYTTKNMLKCLLYLCYRNKIKPCNIEIVNQISGYKQQPDNYYNIFWGITGIVDYTKQWIIPEDESTLDDLFN